MCLVGTFLLLHEEVQETMLEELVAALPVFASGVLGLIPTSLMERDDGVGEMMSLIVVAIWVLIAYGLFLLMRNIYHVFLEAVDPEQKAHASLRKRGPKILARLKRAASSFRRPKSPQEPDLAATAEAARNQLALVPLKAAPVSVDRPLAELSPEGVAAWLFLQELPGDPADVDALGEVVRDRGISGAEFTRLDADALKTMGVATLGLRKAILRRIREDAAAQRAASRALERVSSTRAVVTSESSASRAASTEPGRQLVTRDALVPRAEDAETAEVDAYAEAVKKRRAALRAIFDRVDYNKDGQVSRIEAIKALRKDDEFARMLGFEHHTRVRQEDGTRDKLMLAFGALDENEDKMLSFEEFRHASLVALSSVAPPPSDSGMALGAAGPPTPPLQIGSSGDMKAEL